MASEIGEFDFCAEYIPLCHFYYHRLFFRFEMELDDLPKEKLKELIYEETANFSPRPLEIPDQEQNQNTNISPQHIRAVLRIRFFFLTQIQIYIFLKVGLD